MGSRRSLWYTLAGVVLASLGIASFAVEPLPEVASYYFISHSLWHVFVMASSYALIKGRRSAVQCIASLLGVEDFIWPSIAKKM